MSGQDDPDEVHRACCRVCALQSGGADPAPPERRSEPTERGGEDGVAEVDHEHRTDHTGHEAMFRRRFWVSLVLSIPVVVFSEFVQGALGYTAPTFPGSEWVTPVLAVVVFAYGGVPFLSMARTELANREPGMMMLVSLAITVAFVYSVASLFVPGTTPFFWELVTLVDVMLLGHWMEMRSVRQASGALDELATLVPDTGERVVGDGGTETVPVAIESGDVVLVENDPLDVVRLVVLSRASYRKMQENLVWATGYNVVALPLAAGVLAPVGVLLNPAVGAVLMSLSTVVVAVNARRLRGVDLSV